MTPELIERRNRERLLTLNPEVQTKFAEFMVRTAVAGKPLLITSARRTFFEQEILYKEGRDANGNVILKAAVKTNSRAGMSWHNWGRAVDVAFIDPTGNPTWEGHWEALGEIGEACGLIWSGRWQGKMQEKCHFEDRGNLTLLELCTRHAEEINQARIAARAIK